ncbi:MAG: hypothetical protein HY608_11205 [Planctomycetes bacterium]|nr:hypothetical protein [Planctomycetota bacterium]
MVLDAEGEVLAAHSGARTVDGFRATVRQAREVVALRAREGRSPGE